jgi:hypothetical protein
MGLTSRTTLPLMLDEVEGLVVDEVGDFDAGDGVRVTLLPTFLYIQVQTPSVQSYLRIPLTDLLNAMCLQHGGNEC